MAWILLRYSYQKIEFWLCGVIPLPIPGPWTAGQNIYDLVFYYCLLFFLYRPFQKKYWLQNNISRTTTCILNFFINVTIGVKSQMFYFKIKLNGIKTKIINYLNSVFASSRAHIGSIHAMQIRGRQILWHCPFEPEKCPF